MGDFNNPAHERKEGYNFVIESGFHDTWHLAGQKDEGITVCKTIDGWYDKGTSEKMRIDYIFQNTEEKVTSSQVIFNGDKDPVIFEHFGVQVKEDIRKVSWLSWIDIQTNCSRDSFFAA